MLWAFSIPRLKAFSLEGLSAAETIPQMQTDMNPFPKSLQRVFELIGFAATQRLVEKAGGTRVFIPKYPDSTSVLTDLIGLDAAKALAQEYGHDKIEIPRCAKLLSSVRNERIRSLRAEGWTLRALALEFGMTERAISMILKT
ncbi:hypothetical protein EWI61_00120 [Methylolobus aquaticus]|nr:hypothetical protein EWI61_00120 [Methylolobus aquaticus]